MSYIKQYVPKIILIASSVIILTACSEKAKKTLGLIENIPDEYQVKSYKPLEVPPHYAPSRSAHSSSIKNPTELSETEKSLLRDIK